MRIDPAELRVFGCVADTKSFRSAAEQLGMARSSVSKRISAFETELGVALLNRSTRRISLTDAGRTLYAHWKSIARDIDHAYTAVRGLDERPTGSLRVSVPSSLGAALMPPLVSEFLCAWPELRLSLDFREQHVDVVGKGFDAVIRFAPRLPDSQLVGRRLTSTPCVLAASANYLKRHGRPRCLEDLKQHHCLSIGHRAEQKMLWQFMVDDRPVDVRLTPFFAANNDLALILGACLDAGVLYAPQLLIGSELRLGQLEVIELEDAAGQDFGVFALYPQLNPPSKVRLFVDFVDGCLHRLPETDRWSPLRSSATG